MSISICVHFVSNTYPLSGCFIYIIDFQVMNNSNLSLPIFFTPILLVFVLVAISLVIQSLGMVGIIVLSVILFEHVCVMDAAKVHLSNCVTTWSKHTVMQYVHTYIYVCVRERERVCVCVCVCVCDLLWGWVGTAAAESIKQIPLVHHSTFYFLSEHIFCMLQE